MRILALLTACLVASPFTFAKEKVKPAKEHTLSDFKLGRPLVGKGTLSSAKGKGVVIEAWGVNCPPCIASLPKLQALSEKYKDKVMFFGAESQESDKKDVEAVIKKTGVTFPISTALVKCPIEFSSIPRAFVFDATGKLIYDGSPKGQDFEDAVEKASASVK